MGVPGERSSGEEADQCVSGDLRGSDEGGPRSLSRAVGDNNSDIISQTESVSHTLTDQELVSDSTHAAGR